MRRILSLCLLLALTWPCHAQQKPNTLTPKEIADGWILLFDGETTLGWTVARSLAPGHLKDGSGVLDMNGLGVATIATTMTFDEFELRFDYKSVGGVCMVGVEKTLPRQTLGVHEELQRSTEWVPIRIRVLDGKFQFDANSRITWDGASAIQFVQGKEATLQLRNIKLRPLNTKPLFNGTDLSGWREFPGKKSKFAVIDNAINVKDGPGDLQTVGKFKDVILQLECKSNGKHLNSGVFFRCKDNEYQNGYEAQIRNSFTEKPTQKYLIEDYDPKTNKLLGKKETLFTAVDYGTGAIYRRQPARKQMSKDGEWFGMTIVAHGNHLATWVNGVQVTDWYDNRPKSDNARTGCKLEAGHISIQGHDPTTDLSFKNIRIAEFK